MLGNIWIPYMRVKSEVSAWVSLSDKAKEIIEEYDLELGAAYRETVFKYVSNKMMMNHCIIISHPSGFNFELHPYISRHTFGTSVTMQLCISTEVIQIMLGHEDIESTQIYSRVGNPLVLM